jgi:hypothetical protein
MSVTSGELLVGLLHEANRARAPYAGQWTWEISGTRPNPEGFEWNGHQPTLPQAQRALTAAWDQWLRWAGLRQKEPLRWRSLPGRLQWSTVRQRRCCAWASRGFSFG